MGSPVSLVVANLVMEDVEERAIASYDVHLPFWKRFVDDVCIAVPMDRVQHFLQHLNGIESTMQFTVEVESYGKLPYLDVCIECLVVYMENPLQTHSYRQVSGFCFPPFSIS